MEELDIRPCIVDGEPLCAACDCPAFHEYSHETGRCSALGDADVDMYAGLACIPGLRRQRDEALAKNERLRSALQLAEVAIADQCNDDCESEEARSKGCVFDGPEPCLIGVALRAVRTALAGE